MSWLSFACFHPYSLPSHLPGVRPHPPANVSQSWVAHLPPCLSQLYPPSFPGLFVHLPLQARLSAGCWLWRGESQHQMHRNDNTGVEHKPTGSPLAGGVHRVECEGWLYRGSDCQRCSGQRRRERAFQAERTVPVAVKCQGPSPVRPARTSCVLQNSPTFTPFTNPGDNPVRPERWENDLIPILPER